MLLSHSLTEPSSHASPGCTAFVVPASGIERASLPVDEAAGPMQWQLLPWASHSSSCPSGHPSSPKEHWQFVGSTTASQSLVLLSGQGACTSSRGVVVLAPGIERASRVPTSTDRLRLRHLHVLPMASQRRSVLGGQPSSPRKTHWQWVGSTTESQSFVARLGQAAWISTYTAVPTSGISRETTCLRGRHLHREPVASQSRSSPSGHPSSCVKRH